MSYIFGATSVFHIISKRLNYLMTVKEGKHTNPGYLLYNVYIMKNTFTAKFTQLKQLCLLL